MIENNNIENMVATLQEDGQDLKIKLGTIPVEEPDEIDREMIKDLMESNDNGESVPLADIIHEGEDIDTIQAMGVYTNSNENEVVDVEYTEVEDNIESANVAIEDEENPINETSIKQIGQLLKQVEEMVRIMENNWTISKNTFKLTDTHMKQLYQYNEENRTEMPDDLSEEEQQNWDRFNGLNDIPEEKVIEIFGEEHPIIGVAHTQTIDRIKDAVNDFFAWMSSMKEYRQIHDAYLQLIELEEQKNIEQLKTIAEQEEDPEKKAKMEESIALYYNRKHLEFLAEDMDEKDRDRLVNAFTDEGKIEYWIKRTRDKLKQIKVSDKFILEISQFEKRYLPEKYHKCSNILLLYFMQTIVYADMHDVNSVGRNKAVCMVLALDGIIRKTWPQELVENVLANIMNMEDQIIDMLPDPKPVEKVELASMYGSVGNDSVEE